MTTASKEGRYQSEMQQERKVGSERSKHLAFVTRRRTKKCRRPTKATTENLSPDSSLDSLFFLNPNPSQTNFLLFDKLRTLKIINRSANEKAALNKYYQILCMDYQSPPYENKITIQSQYIHLFAILVQHVLKLKCTTIY